MDIATALIVSFILAAALVGYLAGRMSRSFRGHVQMHMDLYSDGHRAFGAMVHERPECCAAGRKDVLEYKPPRTRLVAKAIPVLVPERLFAGAREVTRVEQRA